MRVRVHKPNLTEVQITFGEFFFSYDICVVVRLDGLGWLRTAERYSNTTSRHVSFVLEKMNATTVPQRFIDTVIGDLEIDTRAIARAVNSLSREDYAALPSEFQVKLDKIMEDGDPK